MYKRGITPSYDSLFAQKLESYITHVFVYSLRLQEIAFKKCCFSNLTQGSNKLHWGSLPHTAYYQTWPRNEATLSEFPILLC